MKIFIIADAQTCLAFALAGIEGRAVERASEVPSILEELAARLTGLILVSEPLAEANREAIDRTLLAAGGPLILEIPPVSGPVPERAGAAERMFSLLRR